MASTTSRLGPGGVGGLASSLRSAASGNNSTAGGAGTNTSHTYYNNNSSNPNLNQSGGNGPLRGQYQRDMDATVPDSDDSTEEDEDYHSYIQEQEQQHRLGLTRQSQDPKNGGSATSARQMLREDDGHDHDMESDGEHGHQGYYSGQDQGHAQHHHDMDLDASTDGQLLHARQNEILEDDEDEFDEDDEDEDMDEDDNSETLSLTEDDIDFNLVYAFHTFVATQEGQASVVRNDSLMLLEDTNVYWWLVRVLKTGVIGYIPAENIETPFERLARLNKYRNVGLSAPSPEWGTFDDPIQPLDPATLAERAQNRRSVIFTAQNEYFGASDNDWDDDEEDGEEDDEMGEYYEEGEEGEEDDEVSDQDSDEGRSGGKTALQLEAERVQQEILDEQRQQQQRSGRQTDYGNEDSDLDGDGEDNDQEPRTNQYRRNLLDDDDLVFSDEPRKISLTPSIAQDDVSIGRMQAPPGKAKKLRLAEDDLVINNHTRSTGPSSSRGTEVSVTQQQHQQQSSNTPESEEEMRLQHQKRMQERTEAKLAALLGDQETKTAGAGGRRLSKEDESSSPSEAVKKPGKFKSLFGVGKGSKEKEKERKEKERLERERLKNTMAKASAGSTTISPGSNDGASRGRSNSNGSLGSVGTGASSNTLQSPTSENSDSLQQEIITLRVYPGNVDFGASMYKTVVVNASTMASEVANQAVVKFRLAPDGVASSTDFFLTVRGVDGDETVLLPTDKPMAIYQSLTAHLTTPLPPNHRLSISSVSSMLSVNSTSSYNSNPPSTPTSPSSVRRIGSGKTDPHQRSIRFLLNKKIRRAGSMSSIPGTPTTPTTPTTPLHDDSFWVKVICQSQDLPQTMLLVDGMGMALEKEDPRAQGQITASKVEHWISMQSTSNAGDVIFKALEKIGIRAGVVDGVPEHVIAAKRNSIQSAIVVEYQLGLRLNGQTSRRARQGDELPLPPQTALVRCFEEHQLTPVRRSPKADIASMPLTPDHVFYLRKSAKSLQAEINLEQEQEQRLQQQQQQQQQQAAARRVPSPLQAQALHSAAAASPRSPIQATSPTSLNSPRSLRSLRSLDDVRNTEGGVSNNGPLSPGLNQNRGGRNGSGASSPALGDGSIRIPRRTDSALMGPTSPTRLNSHDSNNSVHISSGRPSPTLSAHAQHQQANSGSRTPTPDQAGRNRSPSLSQGQGSLRPGQAPSPSGGGDHESSRSSTPDRSSRPERPERQRAISPSMTHGPSPLSLSAVMHQENKTAHAQRLESEEGDSKIAPLNIKKNAAQGMDIIMNKGVIRSSRLMHSKQYRYSFIPLEGGEEVDISEIIEDILSEESDDQEGVQEEDEDEELQHLDVGDDDNTVGGVGGSHGSRHGAASDRDRLQQITNSARASVTLMKLEKSLVGGESSTPSARNREQQQQSSRTGSPLPSQQARQVNGSGQPHNRALASPLSLSSPSSSSSSSSRNTKRDSDVEIQVASVASITTRSASPMLTEQPRAYAHNAADAGPGSPRSLRSASPYGMMAKPTLFSSTGSNRNASSPLKESSVDQSSHSTTTGLAQDTPSTRSFSPIPRRLQTPSPAPKNSVGPSPNTTSPRMRPSSPANGVTDGGPASPVSIRSNSGASIHSTSSARNRSASASSSTHNGAVSKEWLLSSDYNAGMQDLLTLVRAGRSSSVSSPTNSSMLLRGVNGMGGPLIYGKDGKIVALPSTIKASILSRSRSPSLSQLQQGGMDTPGGRGVGGGEDEINDQTTFNDHHKTTSLKDYGHMRHQYDKNDKSKSAEETRMMLFMLNELTLKDVQQDCHPDVYDCWKDVDADLDRVERELDDLLVTVKASVF
ncbi:hypothetical protein EC968_005310 [Mortierella alpina]|nr:hypothetical protein EC968_005310 [Mortierella alpina]